TRARETDAYGYMVKPFQEKELHSTIELALHKHRMERKLRESEECYRTLTEAIPQMVWTARQDGAPDYFNQRWYDYTGLTMQQSMGSPWPVVLHPYDLQRFLQSWKNALSKGEAFEIECCLRRASDQTYRWHLVRAVPLKDKQAILKWFGTCTDIEDEKQSQEFLRLNYTHKRAVLDSALDCIISMDHEGRITDFNPAAEKTFGYRRAEVLGKIMADVVIPPHLRDEHREGMERYFATRGFGPVGKRVETLGMRADGSAFPMEMTVTRLSIVGPPAFTCFIRDITDRKKAEENLERLNQSLKATLIEKNDWGSERVLATRCAACSKVLTDDGEWVESDTYLKNHPRANFTHGYCHECARSLYPEVFAPAFNERHS
ncbi:MAG: PAS domain S-box protein, partial [Verrucomicrobia bacterium]|nr:PAS domain S-box protein [Verrucomicrobiota bacterium]